MRTRSPRGEENRAQASFSWISNRTPTVEVASRAGPASPFPEHILTPPGLGEGLPQRGRSHPRGTLGRRGAGSVVVTPAFVQVSVAPGKGRGAGSTGKVSTQRTQRYGATGVRRADNGIWEPF